MTRMLLILMLFLLPIFPVYAQPTLLSSGNPADAVFEVTAFERDPDAQGVWHRFGYATAFFISPDGTALTASHVVYRVTANPKKYRLIAVRNKEFYNADVLCASKLPYDPTSKDRNAGVPFTRDIAEIKLSPSDAFEGRKDVIYTVLKSGERLEYARAHKDALPIFPVPRMGDGPAVGSHVRIIGFGVISPIQYKWTAEGEVSKTHSARDGTQLFDITYTKPAQSGNSGSPVFNDRNQVIGLLAWGELYGDHVGTAQSARAFRKPCG